MIRTTAVAAVFALAAVPAAGQSPWEAIFAPLAIAPPDGLLANDEGTTAFYAGPMVGLPSLTDTRPSRAGDLAAPGFLTPATAALDPLDVGPGDPDDAPTARQVLEDLARARSTSPKARDGINDVAISVDGSLGHTQLATSYTTTAGPLGVQAKASVVLPGVAAIGAAVPTLVLSTNVRVAMKYRF